MDSLIDRLLENPIAAGVMAAALVLILAFRWMGGFDALRKIDKVEGDGAAPAIKAAVDRTAARLDEQTHQLAKIIAEAERSNFLLNDLRTQLRDLTNAMLRR